ncbi:MAG: hypothetical protein AAGK37_07685 [Pseudomonadota bacterium]
MTGSRKAHGAALVGTLNTLEAWQAEFILDFRMWCDGPAGQNAVWNKFATARRTQTAHEDLRMFEELIGTISAQAHRKLVRRDVSCACICSDEAIFLHLVDIASSGDLHEAAKVASLLVAAAHAERIALLAAHVGGAARDVARFDPPKPNPPDTNVVRLH